MRLLLKVTSSNEYNDGGCEYALVDLTTELATLALSRIATLREQKVLDPNVDEISYWAYFVACYFSPYASPAIKDKEDEGVGILLEDLLGKLPIQGQELVCVPHSFEVPHAQVAAVECEKMVVREDSIAFTAIPKHTSFYVQTVEIPITILEAALAVSVSTSRA